MNKKTSQNTTEGAAPVARKRVRSDGPGLRIENPVLTVPECDTPAELAKFCDGLFPLLATRPPGINVATQAWLSVLGPSLLAGWLNQVEDRCEVRVTVQAWGRPPVNTCQFKLS